MATVGDAIKAAIDANWNVGTGGTEPVLYNTEDVGQGWPPGNDWVMILGWTFRETEKQRNDAYQRVTQYIEMRVHTKNDANGEERLDELVTEIKRVVNATNVTGYHKVKVIDQDRRASDKRTNRYVASLTVELKILSTSSTATPGSTTTSTAEFDELTVNTSIAGNPTAALGDTTIASGKSITMAGTEGAINSLKQIKARDSDSLFRVDAKAGASGNFWVGYEDPLDFAVYDGAANQKFKVAHATGNVTTAGTLTTATQAQIDDLLMFGSANAAPVPCILLTQDAAEQIKVHWNVENEAAHNATVWFMLPTPTTKGALKLYVAQLDLYVLDADATNYIDTLRVYGHKHSDGAITSLDEDATDYNSVQPVNWDMTDIDLSTYSQCLVRVTTVCADDAALNFSHPNLRVYYAA